MTDEQTIWAAIRSVHPPTVWSAFFDEIPTGVTT
jgi:hypothetical protein